MLNKIKFSVVCSVYNSEKYIEECILSVLNNTFSDWEFIILDDGSTDSTLSICKKYSEKHKRIRVYSNKNIGPYNERIIGFTLAKGDYVFNIDADDTFEPNAFEQLNCLIEKHEPDIIIFNEYRIVEGKKELLDKHTYKEVVFNDINSTLNIYFNDYLLMQGLHRKCFKRDILRGVDLSQRDSRMFEDGLFSLKLLLNSKSVLYINDCLYNYRDLNNDSLTKKYFMNIKFDFNIIKEKHILINNSATISAKNKQVFNSVLINILFGRLFYLFQTKNNEAISYKVVKDFCSDQNVSFVLKSKTSIKYLKKRFLILILLRMKLYNIVVFILKRKS